MTPESRLLVLDAGGAGEIAALARDVRLGLTSSPKHLPCRYFYDTEGSRLFEAICRLPEYYLPRAEREILRAHAGEVASRFSGPITLVELGCGSAAKTRLLIEAFLRRHDTLRYVPVDISRTMLEETAGALVRDYAPLDVIAVCGDYEDGLRHMAEMTDRPRLLLWLGSSVGNLHRPEAAAFLGHIRRQTAPHDRVLIGIDLRKDPEVLLRAYDDSQGVTARFNLNILARLNRELDARFDLRAFRHRALYDDARGRIEMHLVSTRPQQVAIGRLGLTVHFEGGESIHTENSYKYSLGEIDALASEAGYSVEAQWLDAKRRFSVNLLAPRPSP